MGRIDSGARTRIKIGTEIEMVAVTRIEEWVIVIMRRRQIESASNHVEVEAIQKDIAMSNMEREVGIRWRTRKWKGRGSLKKTDMLEKSSDGDSGN